MFITESIFEDSNRTNSQKIFYVRLISGHCNISRSEIPRNIVPSTPQNIFCDGFRPTVFVCERRYAAGPPNLRRFDSVMRHRLVSNFRTSRNSGAFFAHVNHVTLSIVVSVPRCGTLIACSSCAFSDCEASTSSSRPLFDVLRSSPVASTCAAPALGR